MGPIVGISWSHVDERGARGRTTTGETNAPCVGDPRRSVLAQPARTATHRSSVNGKSNQHPAEITDAGFGDCDVVKSAVDALDRVGYMR